MSKAFLDPVFYHKVCNLYVLHRSDPFGTLWVFGLLLFR
jgi:hypothetical protein